MSKKKKKQKEKSASKKSSSIKKEPALQPKELASPAPKVWAIGAKVASIEHESWCGSITELDVTPEEFWKNAPTETAKRMSKYQYVRFVREDGCIFGMRKDMIRLIDE